MSGETVNEPLSHKVTCTLPVTGWWLSRNGTTSVEDASMLEVGQCQTVLVLVLGSVPVLVTDSARARSGFTFTYSRDFQNRFSIRKEKKQLAKLVLVGSYLKVKLSEVK